MLNRISFMIKTKNPLKLFVFLTFIVLSVNLVSAQKYSPEWESLKNHKVVPEWFSNAKLGIYFHWGIYSVPANGNEWYPRWMYTPNRVGWGGDIYEYHRKKYGKSFHYHDFIPLWKAPNFNAKQWVDAFEDMGAKIIGAIAEHHDGFSLWESKVNEWNSKNMGPEIDVLKEISDEVKKRDLKFMATFHHGFHNVFYPKQKGKFPRTYLKDKYMDFYFDTINVPQDKKYRKLYGNMEMDESYELWLNKLEEVVLNYSPDYIYTDFGQRYIPEIYRKVFLSKYFNNALNEKKEVVVNTKGNYFPKEVAIVNIERSTIENVAKVPWVTDFVLGSSWAYNKYNRSTIDAKKAIRILAEVVSKNGTMILSAGPMADGSIPKEQLIAMKNIGKWMKLYGESIYNTKPFLEYGEGPTKLTRDPSDLWNEYGEIKKGLDKLNCEDIRYTSKDNILYAIQLGWNSKKRTRILNVFANKAKHLKIKKVSVLGSSEKIYWKIKATGLAIKQPLKMPKEAESALVYKIELK